jgi:hypothetical protein
MNFLNLFVLLCLTHGQMVEFQYDTFFMAACIVVAFKTKKISAKWFLATFETFSFFFCGSVLHRVCRCRIQVPTKLSITARTGHISPPSCQAFAFFISLGLARRSILVLPGANGKYETCLNFYVIWHSNIAVTVYLSGLLWRVLPWQYF